MKFTNFPDFKLPVRLRFVLTFGNIIHEYYPENLPYPRKKRQVGK